MRNSVKALALSFILLFITYSVSAATCAELCDEELDYIYFESACLATLMKSTYCKDIGGTIVCFFQPKNPSTDPDDCERTNCWCWKGEPCEESVEKCEFHCLGLGCAISKTVQCTCTCNTPGGVVEITEYSYNIDECLAKCGGVCGGYANCGMLFEDCPACCADYCENGGHDFHGSELAPKRCKQVCEGKCGFNLGIMGLYEALLYASITFAALIFTVCAIRFITAEYVDSKEKSKRCMIYVIMGLIIIGAASELVKIIWNPPVSQCIEEGGKCMPNPCSEYIDCTSLPYDCGEGYYCCEGECTTEIEICGVYLEPITEGVTVEEV
ncbi:MAG: hypothetical protein B6U97_02010 [Candidatus Altiarchaeales archaeon ex4484_96]|nr:MAG: hypothetical protein B6U97_02010 [Candidatus Altiarchaeales archaeon ex4484_96]